MTTLADVVGVKYTGLLSPNEESLVEVTILMEASQIPDEAVLGSKMMLAFLWAGVDAEEAPE